MSDIPYSQKWQDEQALFRFQTISPLLDTELDAKKKNTLRQQIAQDKDISIRTLYRWEKLHAVGGFSALKPANRAQRRSAKLPKNFSELLQQAILLKREVPLRSAEQIIYILEGEGWVKPGELKRSTLEELNRMWHLWVDEYYHNKPHGGLAEYYRSQGWEVPQGGISPLQEWNRDSRRLIFLDTAVVAEAFLHHVMRNVDKGGCIRLEGRQYEVSAALIGAKVEVAYDPMCLDTVTVRYPGIEPIQAKQLTIGEYCDPKPTVPVSMLPVEPQTSRMLDVLEKKHNARQQVQANAISFSSFRKDSPKGGEPNV